MTAETNKMPPQDSADKEASGGRRPSACWALETALEKYREAKSILAENPHWKPAQERFADAEKKLEVECLAAIADLKSKLSSPNERKQMTPIDIIAKWDTRFEKERQNHEDAMNHLRKLAEEEIASAWEMGGLIQTRAELVEYLGVSSPRVSQILADDRIRWCRHGFSLRDAERYLEDRRPGRPRWNRGTHRPAQQRKR